MNLEESFPVFDLQLDCEFQSSDQKFELKRNDKPSQTFMVEDGDVVALSTIGKRNSNLDKVKFLLIQFSYLRTKSCLMMGIFDGHGDDKVANHLQQYLLQRLSEHQTFNSDIQRAIKQGTKVDNSVLKQIEEQVLQIYQKGSTLLLVIVTETQVIAANVGDSKLFGIQKNDGKLVSLTRQHDLSNQSEVAQIMSKGGLIFKRGTQYRINGELNISRSIGDKKHKKYMSSQPDFYYFSKADYKKIILATDGFYKHELFEAQLCKRSIKQIENKIRKGILGYGFDDNATILALKLKSVSPNSSAEEFFKQKNYSLS